MVRVLLGRLRAWNAGSVASRREVWNDLTVLFWKSQGLMIWSNMHESINQVTSITWHKRGNKQLHICFKHAEMVRFAVATFNINRTVQLAFPLLVKYSQPQLNYGESAPRPSTSLERRQCCFKERIMEQSHCVVLEVTWSHDLIKHAQRHRSSNKYYMTYAQ